MNHNCSRVSCSTVSHVSE